MPDIAAVISSGAHNPWLYLPVALLLGALHALEPGHAKSVMAAFIVAIRGTARQAVLLGLSAAFGHTIVVWGLVALGLWLGDRLILDRAEPWLVLASGLLIMLLALRLLRAIRRERPAAMPVGPAHRHADHDHDHEHDHEHDHDHGHEHHGHRHASPQEIARDYGGRSVSAWEVVWFGFTGGLMPCPAAIAVLLICLQLRAVSLGIAMVAAFSAGLAVTLVAIGLVAAWGVRRAATGWPGFEVWARRLPYASAALVLAMGFFIACKGLFATGMLA